MKGSRNSGGLGGIEWLKILARVLERKNWWSDRMFEVYIKESSQFIGHTNIQGMIMFWGNVEDKVIGEEVVREFTMGPGHWMLIYIDTEINKN